MKKVNPTTLRFHDLAQGKCGCPVIRSLACVQYRPTPKGCADCGHSLACHTARMLREQELQGRYTGLVARREVKL